VWVSGFVFPLWMVRVAYPTKLELFEKTAPCPVRKAPFFYGFVSGGGAVYIAVTAAMDIRTPQAARNQLGNAGCLRLDAAVTA